MSRVKFTMPTPAMIVACVALIVAMAGSAYAALGKNSVDSKQIAPQAVASSEIAGKAVKGADIADGSVKDIKLADNAVTGAKIADNAVSSAKIADGTVTGGDLAPLSVGLSNLNVVLSSRFADVALPDDGTRTSVNASCPAGQVAAGGGFTFASPTDAIDADDFTTDFRVVQSRPALTPPDTGFPAQGSGFNAWRVTAINEAGGPTGPNEQLTATVVCLRPPS